VSRQSSAPPPPFLSETCTCRTEYIKVLNLLFSENHKHLLIRTFLSLVFPTTPPSQSEPEASLRGQPPKPRLLEKSPLDQWTFRSRRLIGICLEDLCKGGSKSLQKSTVLFQYNSEMGRDRKTQTDVKCHVNHPLPAPPSSQRLVRAERSISKC
jgi:hypothetical protein